MRGKGFVRIKHSGFEIAVSFDPKDKAVVLGFLEDALKIAREEKKEAI